MRPGPPGAWHARPAEEALDALASRPEGLTSAEAAERLRREGPNALPRAPAEGVLALLWRQVSQPLIYVLIAAGALSALAAQLVDAAVIAGVVVANALLGFLQELRASREIHSLSALEADECSVLRDGRPRTIDAREVVRGDVLLVEAGDRLPADARLLEARGLTVDEALLTGESVPAEKRHDAVADERAAVPDRVTMVHAGTLASGGRGRAVVVATGAGTQLARISELVASAEQLETPLTRAIAAFSRTVAVAILGLAAVTFGISQAWGYAPIDGFLASVAMAVAAIPEGLPAIITIALAVGVRRMAARNALVRQLPAVETLGSTTVICSDKTGTLTRGEMAVAEIMAGEAVQVTGIGYEPRGAFLAEGRELDGPPPAARAALEAAVLCSDAHLVRRDGAAAIEGDPTEGALVVAAAKAGIARGELEARAPRRDAMPFEPERRYMATLHDAGGAGGRVLLKGAPEAVIARCEGAAWGGPWDPEAALAHAEGMAARGLRVLAVAERPQRAGPASLPQEEVGGGFRLLGLIGAIDPPREEAVRAVAACRGAGVRVVMITGDHPRTAEAVAARLGIDGAGAMTGAELEEVSDEDLEAVAGAVSVFARVAPEHKLRLVAALQRRGEVAAMTGDGVNDAPALRQADIGVAMGVTGTDVSKEAADIVLRDDDFATIEAAVEEGRRVYDNLVKSIAFTLPTSAGQALLILGVIAFGLTLPLLPVQVLWINMITAVALALPLAVEAPEPGLMERPPRRRGEPVLGRLVVERIALVGGLMLVAGVVIFQVETTRGASVEEARTSVATAIVLVQAAYLLACRSLRASPRQIGFLTNPWVFVGIGAVLALQCAFVYAPVMQALFQSAPLGVREWGLSLALAAAVPPLVEAHRRLALRRRGALTGASPTP